LGRKTAADIFLAARKHGRTRMSPDCHYIVDKLPLTVFGGSAILAPVNGGKAGNANWFSGNSVRDGAGFFGPAI
jgi:hypothetical protein